MTTDNLSNIHDLAKINSYKVEMTFFPDAWNEAQNSNHNWIKIAFPPRPKKIIPKKPGVYAFVVYAELFDFIPYCGLLYVGKATKLYERIGGYISELKYSFEQTSRPNIWRMLNQWNGSLNYFYTITKNVEEAESLEDEMLKAFRPHFNTQYPAEVSKIERMF